MIAVTGSNGLLGSFIVKKLVDEGLPVTAIIRKNSNTAMLRGYEDKITWREADVLDVPALADSLAGVAEVIHAAGVVSFNPRQTQKILEVNVEGTRNIVDACLSLKIPRLIHISSVAALGRSKETQTIDEESKWVNSPLNSDYSESKYLAELEVYRGIEEGLRATLINPSVVLAPAPWEKSSAQLFQYVWKEKQFYTEGSLNYVDVRDVAEMIFRIHGAGYEGQKFIASAGAIVLRSILEKIGSRFNKKPPSIRVSSRWTGLVARLEETRSFLAGTEPMVTRQSARFAKETFIYNAQRAKDILQMQFRTLDETLDWCCAHYMRENTINK